MLEENMVIVSVVCMTYNQEKYIKDAIESFLMQKTNCKYFTRILNPNDQGKIYSIL